MIPPEQIAQIKKQLFSQLESLEEPQRSQLQQQISSMDNEQLEEFLIKNNMIKVENQGKNEGTEKGECIFCSIINNNIPSYKLDENKDAITILEINPISEGHIIIIPKLHKSQEKIPTKAFSLAKKISEKIKKILKPKKVDLITGEMFGHGIINVLPVYENEHLGMPRKKASEEKLKELQSKLQFKKREKVIRTKKPKQDVPISKLPRAPHRRA